MPGSAPYVSYAVSGALPLLTDETAVAPTIFERSGGIEVRLDGLSASPATSTLRLRWTVLAPGPSQSAPNSVRFGTRLLARSRDVGPSAGYHDCQPTAWHAGDTVLTWLPLPTEVPAQRIVIQAQSSTSALTTAQAGPVTLLAGSHTRTPALTLPATTLPTAGGSPGVQGIGTPLGLEISMSDLLGR